MKKGIQWSLVAAMMVLAMAVPSMAAQPKVKLTYWSMWEPNPIYMAYLEKAGKEFAQKNPLCEGVEVVKVPYLGLRGQIPGRIHGQERGARHVHRKCI